MMIYFIKFLKDIIPFKPTQTKFIENRLWPRKLLVSAKDTQKYFEKVIYLVLLKFTIQDKCTDMSELQGKQKPNQKNTKEGTEDNEGISL